MGCLLFIIAYILLLPLTVINYFTVRRRGYFRDTALSLDIFSNREFRATWNKWLITSEGYKFGEQGKTISEILGRNIIKGTLSKTGKTLVLILTEKHCLDAINN